MANKNGYTALMFAAASGHIDVVHVLLLSGANKDVANKAGQTALAIAHQEFQEDVARLIVNNGNDEFSQLPDSSAMLKSCVG